MTVNDVSWNRSSFCDTANSCVEVPWSRSSRCTGGDCLEVAKAGPVVLVQDSKSPAAKGGPMQAWSVEEWQELLRAMRVAQDPFSVSHVAVDVVYGGPLLVRFGLDRHEKQTYDAAEWRAFFDGGQAGEFEPERLSNPVSRPADSDVPAGRSPSTTEVDAVATPGQPGPSSEVANQEDLPLISWSEDPSLGAPQDPGVDKGAARRAGQGPGFADRSGVEAAGTGALPPALVPAADEELRIARRERDSLARRLGERFQQLEEARTALAWMTEERDAYQAEAEALTDQLGDMRAALSAAEAEVDRLRNDANEWAKRIAPLAPPGGTS